MNRRMLIGALLLSLAGSALAYKEPTHRQIAQAAVSQSLLRGDALISLGLDSLQNKFPSSAQEFLTIEELVLFGAEFEDIDSRPARHFFDPTDGTGIFAFAASPDWILEGEGQSDEEFSYRKAQEHFVKALSEPGKTDREGHWGRTFQVLGHVIHHLQDMAQPEHVRNDPHLEFPVGDLFTFPWDPSYYERYTRDHPGKWSSFLLGGRTTVEVPLARQFWTTQDGKGVADFTNGNFVSKDSNFAIRNGQLAQNSRYSRPVPGAISTVALEDLAKSDSERAQFEALCENLRSDARLILPPDAECELDFIASAIGSGLAVGPAINKRAASLSMFDPYLRTLNASVLVDDVVRIDRLPVLNRFNFEAAYPFLMPSAVSYSAGLINHFFRGRLQLEEDQAEVNGDEVMIKIKNVSKEGNTFNGGTFRLFYDSYDPQAKNTMRKEAAIKTGAQPNGFAPETSHTITLTIPEDLDLLVEKPFVLVYEGVIGSEEAVSGLVFEVPDLYQGFVFTPGSPLADGVGGTRLLFQRNGEWRLHPQSGFVASEVDWKGWYDNGKPTRVLSWQGRRYAVDSNSPTIFEGGKVFAVAPLPVLGAALQKDAKGDAWLIAICDGQSKDVVFRRAAVRSKSPALYDAKLAPSGWEKIGEFPNAPDLEPLRRAWLFNGSGTEAQTMRERKRLYGPEPMPLTRLKMTVNGTSAELSNLGNAKVMRTFVVANKAEKIYYGDQPITYDFCEESGTVDLKDQVSISGQHVVAVDFDDQREILAYLEVESSGSGTEVGDASEFPYFSATQGREETTDWMLRFDGVEGHLLHKTSKYSLEEVGLSDQPYTIKISSESAFDRASILAMDLRAKILVLRQGNSTHVHRTEGTLEGSGPNVGARHVGTISEELASYYVYAVRAGNEVSHHTEKVDAVDNVTSRPWRFPSDYRFYSVTGGCSQGGRVESRFAQSEEEYTATLETIPALGIKGSGAFAAAAQDRRDNRWVSLTYGDTTSKTFRYYNSLTGGDPVAATGIDPTRPSIHSIKLQ